MSTDVGSFHLPEYHLPIVDADTQDAFLKDAMGDDPQDVVCRLDADYGERNNGLVTEVQGLMAETTKVPSAEGLVRLATLATHGLLVAAAGENGIIPRVDPKTIEAMKGDVRDKGPGRFGREVDQELTRYNRLLVPTAVDTAAWLQEGDDFLTEKMLNVIRVAAKLTHAAMSKQAEADVLAVVFAGSM